MSSLVTAVNEASAVLDAVIAFLPKVGLLGAAMSGVAAYIAAIWPKPEDGGKLSFIHKLVNNMGANVGQAKNAQ